MKKSLFRLLDGLILVVPADGGFDVLLGPESYVYATFPDMVAAIGCATEISESVDGFLNNYRQAAEDRKDAEMLDWLISRADEAPSFHAPSLVLPTAWDKYGGIMLIPLPKDSWREAITAAMHPQTAARTTS